MGNDWVDSFKKSSVGKSVVNDLEMLADCEYPKQALDIILNNLEEKGYMIAPKNLTNEMEQNVKHGWIGKIMYEEAMEGIEYEN